MDEEIERKVIKCLDELKENYALQDIEEIIIEEMELNHLSEKVKKHLEQFIHLQSLQLNNCNLQSLDNLPRIEQLYRICLDHNKLNGKELNKLNIYPNLVSISIMENQFENVDDIKPLALCPNLCQLNLYKNPVADQPKFRVEVFEILNGLILLDNLSKSGDEIGFNEDIQINKTVNLIGEQTYNDENHKKQIE